CRRRDCGSTRTNTPTKRRMTDSTHPSNQTTSSQTLSPSAAYAEFRARAQFARTPLGRFMDRTEFELDAFQVEACSHLQDGEDVLVTAPTGSGKTLIAEFAVELARNEGIRVFYTMSFMDLSRQMLY